MLFLVSTSDLVQVITGAAVTSINCYASWMDYTTGVVTLGNTNTTITTATTTTIVGSPASSAQRNVKVLEIYNSDPANPCQVTVQLVNATRTSQLYTTLLGSLQTLQYTDDGGFIITDAPIFINGLVVAGSNITLSTLGSSVSIIGAPAFSLNNSNSSVSLVAGANITLSQNASTITIIGPTGGANYSVNASTGSVSFVAGNNISLSSNASTITINNTAPQFSLNASSSSVSLIAGAGISLVSNASTITIAATNAFTLNGSIGSLSLVQGTNITLSSNASTITIIGKTYPAATNFSLNGSSSFVSLIAGTGIGLASNASSITISSTGSVVSGFGIDSVTAGGGTLGTTTVASGNILLAAGSNITLSSSAGEITIIGPAGGTSGTLYISATSVAGGATAGTVTSAPIGSTISLVAGTGITLSQGSNAAITIIGGGAAVDGFAIDSITAGGATSGTTTIASGTVSLAAGSNITLSSSAGVITIQGPTAVAATNFSLNGSSSSLSLVAGANIGFSSNASTITISAANSGTNLISGIEMSGNTAGTSSLIQSGTLYLQAIAPILLSQSTTTGTGSTTSNILSIEITNFVSSVNGSSGSLSISAGTGIGIGQANSTITISTTGSVVHGFAIDSITAGGSTSGTTTIASGNILLAAGSNITLSSSAGEITIIGPAAVAQTNFSLNGSSSSVSLIAGTGIGLASNASTITISTTGSAIYGFGIDSNAAGGATQGTTTIASGNILLAAGNNITLSSSGGEITIIGAVGGGGAGTQSLQAGTYSVASTAVSLDIQAGNNITLGTSSNASGGLTVSITGVASAPAVTLGTNSYQAGTYSTTATAYSLDIQAGNNITLGTSSAAGALTVSITGVAASGLLYVSATSTVGGATAGTVTSAVIGSTLSLIAGSGITLGQGSNAAITISGNTTAASGIIYVSASSAAGGATLGTVTSAAIGSTLSLFAGTGITLSQGSNAAITILGNTTAVAPALSFYASTTSLASNALALSLVAGANVTLAAATAAGAMTVSIDAPAASNILYVSATSAAGGSTAGTVTSAAIGSTLSLIAGTNITLSQGSNDAITFQGPAFAAGGGIVVNTSASSQISFSLANSSQVNGFAISSITAGGSTSGTTTVATSGTISLVAGSNITLSSSAGAITVIGGAGGGGAAGTNTFSFGAGTISGTGLSIQIAAGNNISLSTSSAAGSIGATINGIPGKVSLFQNIPLNQAGVAVITQSGSMTSFSSSMFLHRITIPSAMTLTEMDLAMAIAFPASNSGAGTLSQSFQLFSFPAGNTTSLANVLSASSAYTWASGTVTVGGSTSISQFQAGWNVPIIHPLTFASSSIPAGEYVAGHLLNFVTVTSGWTASLFGQGNSVTNSTTLSAVTSVSTAKNASFWALSVTGPSTATSMTAFTLSQAASSASSARSTSALLSIQNSVGSVGGSIIANSGNTFISAVSTSTGSVVPQYLTPPIFVYQGTGSSTAFVGNPTAFIAGAYSTGGTAASIALANVTYSGAIQGSIPFMQLVGS